MLDILKDVADFCDENNIRYYLSSGTLIGAIRHKGFIPWDDDVDIDIPRPDYDRFIDLYQKKGKYSICTPLDKNSIYFYVKVYDNRTLKYESGINYSKYKPLGVDIDVFPIDGQPDEKHFETFKMQTNFRNKIFSYFVSANSDLKGKNIKSMLKIFVCRIVGKNYFCKLYINSAMQYSFENSSLVGFISPYSRYSNRHRKEVYQDRVKVQFEDGLFWAPIGYDEYLRNIYGNYMQLPPIEQQQTHHTNNIFWKDYVENSK